MKKNDQEGEESYNNPLPHSLSLHLDNSLLMINGVCLLFKLFPNIFII